MLLNTNLPEIQIHQSVRIEPGCAQESLLREGGGANVSVAAVFPNSDAAARRAKVEKWINPAAGRSGSLFRGLFCKNRPPLN